MSGAQRYFNFLTFRRKYWTRIHGIVFLQYLSVDGKLGNKTYIDVLPESSSQCPPNFTLIGFFFSERICSIFWLEKLVLLSFRGISTRLSQENIALEYFMYVFLGMMCNVVSGVELPIFES